MNDSFSKNIPQSIIELIAQPYMAARKLIADVGLSCQGTNPAEGQDALMLY